MKKLTKISAGVIVWLAVAMVLVSVVFFEDYYKATPHNCKTEKNVV